MAGARQGWREAAYAPVPCPPVGGVAVRVPTSDARLDVRILPGLCQTMPADVMRGEETQIAGFLAGEPAFDGCICLPGTHTKWARVADGEVRSFRTCMTGEIYELLTTQSVLRHSVGAGWSESAFAAGLDAGVAAPESLMGALFGIRAESLLADLAPEAAAARLSGLMIGSELAAMREVWQGRSVAVIGSERLARLYSRALEQQGTAVIGVDAKAATLAGLRAGFGRNFGGTA
jgi:2-dehydro-3-deoxygalactonokinase